MFLLSIGIRVIIRYNPRTFEGTYLYDISQKKKVPLKRTNRVENGKQEERRSFTDGNDNVLWNG